MGEERTRRRERTCEGQIDAVESTKCEEEVVEALIRRPCLNRLRELVRRVTLFKIRASR